MAVGLLVGLVVSASALAQGPGVHYYHHGIMPPGAIGSQQLQRGGPLPGFYQPVEIKAPPGVLVSLAIANQFADARRAPQRVGMLIGQVYRLRVTNIPLHEGMELFPSIEVIDRLYAPVDQQVRFAIPVELGREDIELALAGKFVTRVIYLEDPLYALPTKLAGQPQAYFDVPPGGDPLATADGLGRPVAILRLGARLPDEQSGDEDPQFFFGSPPFIAYGECVPPTDPPTPHLPAEMAAKRTASANKNK